MEMLFEIVPIGLMFGALIMWRRRADRRAARTYELERAKVEGFDRFLGDARRFLAG